MNVMIRGTSTLRRSPNAVHRQLAEDGAVLLNLESGQYYTLNDTGLLIWSILERDVTFDEMVEEFRQRVRNTPPELGEDLAEFVDELRSRDLLLVEEGG